MTDSKVREDQEVTADADASAADHVDSGPRPQPRGNAVRRGGSRPKRSGSRSAKAVSTRQPALVDSGPGPSRPNRPSLDAHADGLFRDGTPNDRVDTRSALKNGGPAAQLYRCGNKPLMVPGGQTIQPGEIVPGTEEWPRLESWVRARRIVPA